MGDNQRWRRIEEREGGKEAVRVYIKKLINASAMAPWRYPPALCKVHVHYMLGCKGTRRAPLGLTLTTGERKKKKKGKEGIEGKGKEGERKKKGLDNF